MCQLLRDAVNALRKDGNAGAILHWVLGKLITLVIGALGVELLQVVAACQAERGPLVTVAEN
jgi:hypothetical protein